MLGCKLKSYLTRLATSSEALFSLWFLISCWSQYVKDWKPRFEANQLVKGRIIRYGFEIVLSLSLTFISIDAENKKVEMTFRSGDLNRAKPSSSLSLVDLHENQKLDGRVKKIEDYGLFIEIEGSKLCGLCHKSEVYVLYQCNHRLVLNPHSPLVIR